MFVLFRGSRNDKRVLQHFSCDVCKITFCANYIPSLKHGRSAAPPCEHHGTTGAHAAPLPPLSNLKCFFHTSCIYSSQPLNRDAPPCPQRSPRRGLSAHPITVARHPSARRLVQLQVSAQPRPLARERAHIHSPILHVSSDRKTAARRFSSFSPPTHPSLTSCSAACCSPTALRAPLLRPCSFIRSFRTAHTTMF